MEFNEKVVVIRRSERGYSICPARLLREFLSPDSQAIVQVTESICIDVFKEFVIQLI